MMRYMAAVNTKMANKISVTIVPEFFQNNFICAIAVPYSPPSVVLNQLFGAE
jgi:hypothetical protein